MALIPFVTQDGIKLGPGDDIVDSTNQTVLGAHAAGGIFSTSYTYQQGMYLDGTLAAGPGCFSTESEDDSSDLVQDTRYLYVDPVDANGKNNSKIYNWLVDAGVGAQIRVTDPQGNQVARLVTTENVFPEVTNNMYNGFQIYITRMFGNNTANKAKIAIVPDNFNGWDGDWSANSDWMRWYMYGKEDPIILSVYGENKELPLDLTELWNFATRVTDLVSGFGTVAQKQEAFMNQVDTLIADCFTPGTLYKDFEFYNNGYNEVYFDVDSRVTVTTSAGTGGYFQISWDETHFWVRRNGSRVWSSGNGYQVGDTFFVLGSYFPNGNDGVNDMTLTVTEVDSNGGIRRWSITGTPPAVSWPGDWIINGGSYQEYYSNQFFTNITGNNAGQGHNRAAAPGATLGPVRWNGGTVSSTEGYFTAVGQPAGEYVVAYKSSVLALFVKGNTAEYIETDGDSGSNTGHLDFRSGPDWQSYGLALRVVEGGGSWTPGTKYTFTFDFNNGTGRIKFNGNSIYAEPNNNIWMGTYGGEGYVYIPQDQYLGWNQVEISNQGYTNPQTNVYENAGVQIYIWNGGWSFKQDINNANNANGTDNFYIQNPNGTRTVTPYWKNCAPGQDSVVYTCTNTAVASLKLFLHAEGAPDGAPYNWGQYYETQATDAIVVSTPDSNSATYATPFITVYGRVYTGADPVATFTVRRNPTTNRIEVLARPTSTTYYAYVNATVTEVITYND